MSSYGDDVASMAWGVRNSISTQVSEPPDTPAPAETPRETEASKMSFLSVFSFGGSPTSQDAPTPVKVKEDEVVEIKVAAPAPEPAVEVKKAEPQPAPAKKACCVVC